MAILSPKMAEHYAKLAREGKARDYLNDGKMALFDVPGQPSREICLVIIDEGCATGHISKKNR